MRLVALIIVFGGLATFAPLPVTHLENGARIFLHGVTAQGRIVQNSHGMEGVGCAMCHGEEGRGGTMHGIQAWVGLPVADEETAPAFSHYAGSDLPTYESGGLWARPVW